MQFEGGAFMSTWVYMCTIKVPHDEIRKESSEAKSKFQSFTIDMCSFKLFIFCYYITLIL
jgi:hypothetical protein